MFIAIVLFTLGFIAIITVRDWVTTRHASSRAIQKNLRKISQAISLQEWEKAEQGLIPLLESGRGGKEAALFEIQVLRGTGNFQAALQKVEENSRLFPEELLFRLEEAQILLELEKAQEALEAFRVCTPILRKESDLLSLATAFYKTGFPQESFEILYPLLQTTQNGHIPALAGDALYELKLFSKAIESYKRALQLGCQTHRVFIQLGNAYRRFGKLADAEYIFRCILEKNHEDIDATLGLGTCLQERGHHNKALLIYQNTLSNGVKDFRLIYQAGYAALRTKKYRFAELYFLEVMQQHTDPQIIAYYGFCLENQKKWQEAEQTYLKLVHLFPAYLHGYRALAWMFGVGLSQTISQAQGLNYAHRALKLKNDALSWEILSACIARTGLFDKAYQIQLGLSKQDKDPQAKARRQQSLRTLRKKMPLGNHQVLRSEVA